MENEPEKYSLYMSREDLIELLKKDDKNNECIKTIDHIKIQGGTIYVEGKQHKIIDGKIITEGKKCQKKKTGKK